MKIHGNPAVQVMAAEGVSDSSLALLLEDALLDLRWRVLEPAEATFPKNEKNCEQPTA
ncbi:hypothetical protein [Citrifermentans bremense]|uniref:hypothetical protein n=1 Tax=Citrifermentans bremense TaxID=60035 RepID=UPI00162A8E8F|nr:hypothetical protein [Citrifermentans bremense]